MSQKRKTPKIKQKFIQTFGLFTFKYSL